MIKVVFKNFEATDAIRQILTGRAARWVDKFPALSRHSITLTAEQLNSKIQPGPDRYRVQALIVGNKYQNLCLSKEASDLYGAMSQVDEATLELLNRAGDRDRVRARSEARRHVPH